MGSGRENGDIVFGLAIQHGQVALGHRNQAAGAKLVRSIDTHTVRRNKLGLEGVGIWFLCQNERIFVHIGVGSQVSVIVDSAAVDQGATATNGRCCSDGMIN